MKKILLFVILFASFNSSNSQVIVTLQISPEGLSVKPQLWNALLINTGNSSIIIKINLSLTDVNSGQQVLYATSSTFDLPQGATNITAEHVMPISYTVLNNTFNFDQSLNDFIPIGNYTICYQVLKQNTESFEEISEECENITIEPLSPPILTTPDDMGQLEDARPLFTWAPPAPLALFTNLTYKYSLVEVLQGQSSSAAIQQNIPLLQQNGIINMFLQFPLSQMPLDTSKIYAWQVTANSNSLPVSNSEIWTFKITSANDQDNKSMGSGFIKLRKNDEIPITIGSDYLRYEYLNESNDSLVNIMITDITSNNLKVIGDGENLQKVQFGQNYIEMNLQDLNLEAGHFYLFKLTNTKNESWFTKFEFQKK